MSQVNTAFRTLIDHALDPLQTEAALHGFLTACVLTPDESPVAGCLEAGFGVSSSEDLPPDVHAALQGLLEQIKGTLQAGNFRFDPPLSVTEAERWCKGYVAGIAVADGAWSAWNDDNIDAAKAMLAIQAIANPELRELFVPAAAGPDGAATGEELARIIAPAVRKIAIFRFADEQTWEYLHDEDPFYEIWPDAELAEMDDEELVAKLLEWEDQVPRILIDECIRRAETLVPRLRALLSDDAMWKLEADEDAGSWWALMHAMHILGALRGEAAGDAMAAALGRLRTDPDDPLWEWLSPHWGQLCQGKEAFVRPVLQEVAEDRSADPFGRSLAMEWLSDSHRDGVDDGLEALLDWVASRITDPSEDAIFRELGGQVLLDHPRERFRPLLMEQARSFEAAQTFGIPYGVGDVERRFSGADRPLRPRAHFLSFYNPNEIRLRQLRWMKEDGRIPGEEGDPAWPDDLAVPDEQSDYPWPEELPMQQDTPYVRETPKVGRNDPCPCGSGKKYKKCCMRAIE
jgi:yecA family protein